MAENKPYIGGQAVLEGVMMRSPTKLAIAVRRIRDKKITVQLKDLEPPTKRAKILGWPVIRGVVAFIESMVNGVKTISDSAVMAGDEEQIEEPSKFEKWVADKLGKKADDVMMGFAVVLAVALSVGLFFIVPSLAGSGLQLLFESKLVVNLLEGLIRLLIFIGYIAAVARVKEIKRVFSYHGAEHKTVHCYEHGDELTVENCRKYSTQHPRCGTAFMLIVMLFAILCYSIVGTLCAGWGLEDNVLTRVLTRIILLPLIAGCSYELLRLFGKYDNAFVRVVRAPGMWLQRLTTREPDDTMLEVAICAMKAAAGLPYEDMTADEQADAAQEDPAAQPEEAAAQAETENPPV